MKMHTLIGQLHNCIACKINHAHTLSACMAVVIIFVLQYCLIFHNPSQQLNFMQIKRQAVVSVEYAKKYVTQF